MIPEQALRDQLNERVVGRGVNFRPCVAKKMLAFYSPKVL